MSDPVIDEHFLNRFHIFSFLKAKRKEQVIQTLERISFSQGETVFTQGSSFTHVYLIASGCIESVSESKDSVTLSSPSVYGLSNVLFEIQGERTFVSLEPTVIFRFPGEILLTIFDDHENEFTLAVSDNLRFKQDVFHNFREFRAALLTFMSPGKSRLNFDRILSLYKNLSPAIHHFLNDSRIDTDALTYAVKRLPENITSVFAIVLSQRVINVLQVRQEEEETIRLQTCDLSLNHAVSTDPEDLKYAISTQSPGRAIPNRERRRTCWEVMPGKLFILLREGTEDFIDVITNLCIVSLEGRKLRKRLKPVSECIQILQSGLKARNSASAEKKSDVTRECLQKLGKLTAEETNGLMRVWPNGDLLENLFNFQIQHGDYNIFFDGARDDHYVSASERWMARVRTAAESLVGNLKQHELPLTVDIISSNTYSFVNLLSPYLHEHKEKIMAWGKENFAHLEKDGVSEADMLYVYSARYFDAMPREALKKEEAESKSGILNLLERELTGISVQLVHFEKLRSCFSKDGRPLCDEFLAKHWQASSKHSSRHLLINIDFAFGGQAERILRLLIMLFGESIRSVNVMGKAGGLVGSRGDILFPTHILDERTNGEMRSVDNSDISPMDLRNLTGRRVHIGPVLTVEGTLMQNRHLLLFYERLWNSIGLEMEGNHYLKTIDHCVMLGLLRPTVKSRFLYYTSDTPLLVGTTLSQDMTLAEIVSPLYGITRLIADRVCSDKGVLHATDDPFLTFKQSIEASSHLIRLVSRDSLDAEHNENYEQELAF
jgi:CRP-like cAMP-binding protein